MASGVARGFLGNSAFGVIAAGLSALAMTIAVNQLTVNAWGVAAALLGATQLIGGLLSFGTPLERIRRYSRLPSADASDAALLDTASRTLLAFLILLAGALVALLNPMVGAVMMGASGVFLGLGTGNYFISQGKYIFAGLLIFLEKLIFLLIVLALVGSIELTPLQLPLALAVSGSTTSLLSWLLVAGPRAAVRVRPSLIHMLKQYRLGFHLGISSIAPNMLLLDATIVLTIAGPIAAGNFGLGARVVGPMAAVLTSLVAVLLPYFSSPGRLHRLTFDPKKLTLVVLTLTAFVMALIWSASWWVAIIFGSQYSSAVTPVRLYLLNILFVFGTRTLATILQGWNDDRTVSVLVSAQVALALAGIALGAVVAGANGAAVSLAASNLVLLVALTIRVRSLRVT